MAAFLNHYIGRTPLKYSKQLPWTPAVCMSISPDLKIKMFETWPNVLRSYLISVIVYLVKSSDCTIALTIVPAQRRPASMKPLPLNSLRAFWICSLSASAPLPQTAVEGPLVHPHSEVWIPIIPGWCAVPSSKVSLSCGPGRKSMYLSPRLPKSCHCSMPSWRACKPKKACKKKKTYQRRHSDELRPRIRRKKNRRHFDAFRFFALAPHPEKECRVAVFYNVLQFCPAPVPGPKLARLLQSKRASNLPTHHVLFSSHMDKWIDRYST